MEKFEIDFFELMFLAEECIQPTPIARHVFWINLCDKHYHKMSFDERSNAFKWIQKNSRFSTHNIDNLYWYCRFNPDNQYIVTGKDDKQAIVFLFQENYHYKRDTMVNLDFIKSIEKYEKH